MRKATTTTAPAPKATAPTVAPNHAPAATPNVVSPLPVVASNGYATGLVRYVRSLKATGHALSAYNTSGATTGLAPAFVALLARTMPATCKAQRYVVHCHTCNVWLGFAAWAPAYAASMAHASTALAPSVAASLGKAGLAALGLPGLTVRPAGTTPAPASQPIEVPAPLALGPGQPARFHQGCAPAGAIEVHDMDDATLRCSGCGRSTYGVNWIVQPA